MKIHSRKIVFSLSKDNIENESNSKPTTETNSDSTEKSGSDEESKSWGPEPSPYRKNHKNIQNIRNECLYKMFI